MKIYQIEVIDPDYPGWNHQSYKGRAIVREKDENAARGLLGRKFGNFTPVILQRGINSPWDRSDVVSCTEYAGSDYSVDGPAEILVPNDDDGALVYPPA